MFVSYPEAGLINPLLVLAEELSRRGVEDLWFATDENRSADIKALQVKTPVQFASLGPVVPELSAKSWDDKTYHRTMGGRSSLFTRFKAKRAVLKHTLPPHLRVAKYRALEAKVREIRPAVMVIESLCPFAIELAITKNIPYVLGVPFMPSNVLTAHIPFAKSYTPHTFPVPHSGLSANMSFTQQVANQLFKLGTLAMFLDPRMGKLVRQDKQVRQQLGISPRAQGFLARIEAAEKVLCYSVRELDYPFSIPDKVRLIGTMVPPLPEAPHDTELTEWLDAQKSVIYMGFGTITRMTRQEVGAMVEVARRLDGRHQILWKLPTDQQKLLPSRLPGNLRIESWVPSQLDVLAHPNVKVFFNHTGGRAFHEGLYFGKPLVARPLWVDCHDQAIRGQDFGVSLTLDKPETIDADDVVDKLTRVLDNDSFRERAEYFARLQHAAGGRHAAADEILNLPALA
jgi:polyene glycosyltransferase